MVDEMRYMNVPPRNIRRRRLLIFIPIILLILFLYVIGYRATALRREATKYTDVTNTIAGQSNFLGKQFRAALNSGGKSKFLTETLDNIVDQALGLSQRAEAIEPPKDLKLAHSYFVVAMKLRHQGLEKYNRYVINSMSSVQSKQNQSSKEALEDIRLSDKAYAYFIQEAKNYLNSNGLKIKLKESVYLPAGTKQLSTTSANSNKTNEIIGEPDIFVEDVATVPLRVSYNPDNDIRVLPDTSTVYVRIEVGNKGKVEEKDIAVETALYNNDKFVAKKSGVLDSIQPGETSKITTEEFEVSKEGLNVFKIQVGPLLSEKNKQDNYYSYKFIIQTQGTSD